MHLPIKVGLLSLGQVPFLQKIFRKWHESRGAPMHRDLLTMIVPFLFFLLIELNSALAFWAIILQICTFHF